MPRGICGGSTLCWQPDTRAPAEPGRHRAAAWLSFQPDSLRTDDWGGGTWGPSCSLQPVLGPEEGRERCARSWQPGTPPRCWLVVPEHPGGSPPSPPGLGAPKPSSELPRGGFAPTLSPGGCGDPPPALLQLPGVLTPFMGLESARQQSGLGKVPAQPLAGESVPRPGEPPPCPPSAGRELGGVQRPARLLPANPFPCACPLPHRPLCCRKRSSS